MINSDRIFQISSDAEFESLALEIFRFQAQNCAPYTEYLKMIGVDWRGVDSVLQIPFMPVELFKNQRVYCGSNPPQICFTSSSTSGMEPASHYVADLAIYEKAFTEAFTQFYGNVQDVTIFALLPSYLERQGSSLIYMTDSLIKQSGRGGFYLHDYEKLIADIRGCEGRKILLGVSYALWDLAEQYPQHFDNTVIMETGGMKGHREELSKAEFHALLKNAFGVDSIHSEYGMAELLSQGYSDGEGRFRTPAWLKAVIRDVNDPFELLPVGKTGGINIIDLANVYSCSFLQTQDLGTTHSDGSFTLHGRIANSDIRGCNLLVQ